MEITKQYFRMILPLFTLGLVFTACSMSVSAPPPAALMPAHASDSGQEDKLFIEGVFQRIDEALAAEEKRNQAELLRREKEERAAQQKYQNLAQARREAERYLRERQAAENAVRTRSERTASPGELRAVMRATENAQRAVDTAHQRERDAKSTYEEKIREREAMARNEAIRRQMVFENAKAKQEWQLNPTPENLAKIEPVPLAMASSLGITSRVDFTTNPLPGAVVYYQTKAERAMKAPPLSLGPKTNCSETLPIARYYIWAQRGDVKTSDPERLIRIYRPAERVDLDESYKSGGQDGQR